MFLYQKFAYKYKHIQDDNDFVDFINTINTIKPSVVVYDTETTGLNIMKDKPFLMSIGFEKHVYTLEPKPQWVNKIWEHLKDIQYLIAHNAKYDYHMMINNGTPIPENIKLADSMIVARLTEYSDSMDGIGLDDIGTKYVDKDAKFASSVIKQHINQINRKRLQTLKSELKKFIQDEKLNYTITEVMNAYYSRISLIQSPYQYAFNFIDKHYKVPNYKDSYQENPNLMVSYAADDIVIVLEYLQKVIPTLEITDPNYNTFNRECELIRVVGDMERVGLPVDSAYLLASREKVKKYIDNRYETLFNLTNKRFTSGQHKVIMQYFMDAHQIYMNSADIKALEDISNKFEGTAKRVADIIIELRTLDKWLSTYIEGMLNRIYDGRVHTSINNSGAITGRVSSDLQQQPKDPLLDADGNELFHPRRVFINDKDTRTFYFDFSQMELRVQAHYTLILGDGDLNLTRAFMPYRCTSILTGQPFSYGVDDIHSGEWVNEDNKPWTPTDLHSATTLQAFPDLKLDDPNFSHYRSLGKRANFAKNYGAGWFKLMESLKISEDIAKALDAGYNKAFPKVRDYQRWVDKQLQLYGYVQNLYGRRYYVSSSNNFYKSYNYLIQGSCADLMKMKEVDIAKFLKDNNLKSKMLLVIHDEVQLSIPKDEEWIVPKIRQILDDNDKVIHTLPMICEVEVTNKSWADKEEYEDTRG
jgi:DNA polymerase-1